MGHVYVADAARGVRWDDPAFAIDWPQPPASARCPSATPATRTSCREPAPRARHRRERLRRPARAGAAARAGLRGACGRGPAAGRAASDRAAPRSRCRPRDGCDWHAPLATCLDAGTQRTSTRIVARGALSPSGRRICCTSPGTPSPARSGTRARTPRGSPRRSASSTVRGRGRDARGARRDLRGVRLERAAALREDAATGAGDVLRRLQGRHAARRGGPRRERRAVARLGADLLPLRPARGRATARRERRAQRWSPASARRRAPACSGATSCTSTTSPARSRRSSIGGRRGAVNVGSGEAVTVRTVVESLAEAPARPELLDIGALRARPRRAGRDRRRRGAAARRGGVRPDRSLAEGLRQTVDWWRER